jgi:Zn finger protein HypA/HybF involved in hydrogenase expression
MDSELRNRISKLSNEELLEMVEGKTSDYRKESLDYAAEELGARGIPLSLPTNPEPYECNACGADASVDANFCPNCGADISEVDEVDDSAEAQNTESVNLVVQNKYPALQIISTIFKVLAVIAAIAGLIGALVGLGEMAGNTYGATAAGGVIVLVSLLYGGLGCIYMLAISEGIRVFIDIEANTNLTNKLLRKLLDK